MAKEQYSIIDIPAKGLTAKQARARVAKENNVIVVASRLEEQDGVQVFAHVVKHAMPGDVTLPAEVEDVIAPEEDPFGGEEEISEEKSEGDLAAQVSDIISQLQGIADQLGGGDSEDSEDEMEDSDDSPFGGDSSEDDDSGLPFLSKARLAKTAGVSYERARASALALPSQDPGFKGYKLTRFEERETEFVATYKRK